MILTTIMAIMVTGTIEDPAEDMAVPIMEEAMEDTTTTGIMVQTTRIPKGLQKTTEEAGTKPVRKS